MTVDPRAALDRLIAALEAHYTAVAAPHGEDDPAVDDAYDILADAFEVYDDALGTVHGEATPFYLAEEDDDEDDEDDDETRTTRTTTTRTSTTSPRGLSRRPRTARGTRAPGR